MGKGALKTHCFLPPFPAEILRKKGLKEGNEHRKTEGAVSLTEKAFRVHLRIRVVGKDGLGTSSITFIFDRTGQDGTSLYA